MTDPAHLAALLAAPPDPEDHEACLRHRRELERAGFVARWDGEVECVGTYEDWVKHRLEEYDNGNETEVR